MATQVLWTVPCSPYFPYPRYFSAHWCPPCRGFTPKLAEWYKKDPAHVLHAATAPTCIFHWCSVCQDLQGKGLEIVFVSADRSEEEFKEYFAEMPWLALDFSQKAASPRESRNLRFATPATLSGGQPEAEQEIQGTVVLPSTIASASFVNVDS